MTVPVVLTIAGVVALFLGVWGGGIKAKEIEIPRAPAKSRVILTFVGFIFIGIAIWLSSPNANNTTEALSPKNEALPTTTSAPTPVPTSTPVDKSNMLTVEYLGQDGSNLIGSNCPGDDYRGSIVDRHIRVTGINPNKVIEKIIVAGEPGSRWETPCQSPAWELLAIPEGAGEYDLYFAPVPDITNYQITVLYRDGLTTTGNVTP